MVYRYFVGPRAFERWESALAYALLPAHFGITLAARRRVYRGASGRWMVVQTTRPRGAR